jgi:hypothetical protein
MAFANQIPDSEGGIGVPLIALSALAIMERHNTITPQMRGIGETFHTQFRLASLDGLKAASVDRIPMNFSVASWRAGGNERARRRVADAIKLLGGDATVPASCAWHVLGLEWSLREWAAIWLRGNKDHASGAVITTLSLLEGVVASWS